MYLIKLAPLLDEYLHLDTTKILNNTQHQDFSLIHRIKVLWLECKSEKVSLIILYPIYRVEHSFQQRIFAI